MSDFTVLVCGGRQYLNREKVFAVLDDIHADKPVMRVIEGGCRGADAHARAWALSRPIFPMERSVSWSVYDADWHKHGKAAGPLRNQRMLDEGKPDLVVAFGGGRGTHDMLKRARKAGVPIKEIDRQAPHD